MYLWYIFGSFLLIIGLLFSIGGLGIVAFFGFYGLLNAELVAVCLFAGGYLCILIEKKIRQFDETAVKLSMYLSVLIFLGSFLFSISRYFPIFGILVFASLFVFIASTNFRFIIRNNIAQNLPRDNQE
ncbi:MAG: hypothetical protein ACW98I_11900 [Candidatus Hodarchaeales archaeon]|jgi:hypothetical protein